MTLRLLPAFPGITYPVKRSPLWSTDLQEAISGKITSLQNWSYPKYAFELGYEFLRMDTAWLEYQDLVAFYNLAGGRANIWRFHDPNDGSVTLQPFGTGDGATLSFQLLRATTGFYASWVDPVFYPTASQIFIAGTPAVVGVDYTISTTGLVTFTNPPGIGAALTWTGTFDWLVRFDDDSETFEQFTYNLMELKALKFTSEKI